MSLEIFNPVAKDFTTISGDDSSIEFVHNYSLDEIQEADLIISGNGQSLESSNTEQPEAWTLSDCAGCIIVPDCWVSSFGTGLLQYKIKLTIKNTPEPYTVTVQNGLFIRR